MEKVIERIFPPLTAPAMVGDGFRVLNIIPGAGIPLQRMSPFLMLDFNVEFEFAPSEKLRGVKVHPHKGVETVTIAYKGSLAHIDSAGNTGVIDPGDVQWMTAGSGILHKEFQEETWSRQGGPFEMVQLWINLPGKNKSVSPHYQHLKAADINKFFLPADKGVVNVIAGSFQDVTGTAGTYTPLNVWDLRLKDSAEILLDVAEMHNAALLVVNGRVEVNNTSVQEHCFVLFGNQGAGISLKATGNCVLLFLSGEPIEEPIVSYGPLIMNTQAEIDEAIEDYQAGKFGNLFID